MARLVKLSDLIDPDGRLRSFQPEEIAQCHTTGECVQCGLCCVAFPVDGLPLTPPTDPTARVTTFDKPALEPCRYLELLPDGRLGCACHAAKTHPAFDECVTFAGNEPRRDVPGQRGYDAAVSNLLEGALLADTPEAILAAELFFQRGAAVLRVALGFQISFDSLLEFLDRVLRLPQLPHHLLNALELKESLALLSHEDQQAVQAALGLDAPSLTPVQHEFLSLYFNHDTGAQRASALVAK